MKSNYSRIRCDHGSTDRTLQEKRQLFMPSITGPEELR